MEIILTMEILLACEESQTVCTEFRKLGHEAYSCDVLPTSGNNPEWHIQSDVIPVLTDNWDMVIAFPPCTHLASSGAAWFEEKRKDGRQQQAIEFFMQFVNLNHVPLVAIENPIGIMSKEYRKPNQIIQPYQFGDSAQKSTCLWLKGLPELKPTKIVDIPKGKHYKNGKHHSQWSVDTFNLPRSIRAKVRSKTFPGIAWAMANQWSNCYVQMPLFKIG